MDKPIALFGTQETFGGKTLSEIVSELAHVEAQETFGYAEAHAFGADDVGGIIAEGAQRRQMKILADAGLSLEEFNELLERRTDGKWAFFGIGNAAGRILNREYPQL